MVRELTYELEERIGAALFSGILIGISCMANMEAGGGIIGALFFPVGLISIILLGLPLYTGRIGYIKKPEKLKSLSMMLLFNMVGAAWLGLVYRLRNADVNVIETKLDKPLIMVFFDAVLCGILIYASVEGYKRSKSILAVVFPVSVFVLIGAEHCIADAFYIAAGINLENLIYSVLWIAVVVAGNTAGAIILNAVSKEESR